MGKSREPFGELRAIAHRRALERRGELRSLAGDAAGTMKLLTLVIDIIDSAVADARSRTARHRGYKHGCKPRPSLRGSLEVPANLTELDAARRPKPAANRMTLVPGSKRRRTLGSGEAALRATLIAEVDEDRVGGVPDA